MPTMTQILATGALLLVLACTRASPRAQPASSQTAAPSPVPAVPTRLISLPVSAYLPALALDGDTAYLLTSDAAYRLVVGEPPRKFELDLGIGPVLTESGIVFWSKGAIWNAAKDGGPVVRIASVPKQPAYFVASSGGIAWLDQADDNTYRVQSLNGQKSRLLVADRGEISALHMVQDWVFFVQRAKDNSWRIGRVHVAGGQLAYTDSRTGPTPATLTGSDTVIYYDMDKSEIRQLMPDLVTEHVWLKDYVCSPIFEANNIFCSRVEGLFEVLAESHTPKFLLSLTRVQAIPLIRANSKRLVWLVDTGPDQLAVDTLSLE